MNTPATLLIIGKVWPEPKSSAAGSRMIQLIEVFSKEGWEIIFASAASKSGFEIDLTGLGIEEVRIELNSSSFDDFIQKLKPDVVLFDRFMTEEQFGWRVDEYCPQALRILDTEDLHCLRKAREQAWKEDRDFKESDLFSDIAKREVASIYRSDLSLIISEAEMGYLKDIFKVPDYLLHYLPFMFEKMDHSNLYSLPGFGERQHFVSIGNFLHQPNWNAVLYLKEEIWPLIRKELPQAELHVYGAYASQKAEQLHNEREGFLVKGRAEDAKEVVRKARVLLAPLRFGAGLKGKLTEAMQCGTPSVTTSIGAEAMHGKLDWPGAIEDDPEKFAHSAIRLYKEEKLWKHAQRNGIEVMNRCFEKESTADAFINRVASIYKNISRHREKNFTGAMLVHHTAASTRFMAKWIEEKNQE